MTQGSQFEQHPDLESLNAFVENALPEQERVPMIAHLAACSRCRQVVYLAQSAVEETVETTAKAPQPNEARGLRKWLAGIGRGEWRPALAAAAACAVLATVTIAVLPRHTETRIQQEAKNLPSAGRDSALKPAPQATVPAKAASTAGEVVPPAPKRRDAITAYSGGIGHAGPVFRPITPMISHHESQGDVIAGNRVVAVPPSTLQPSPAEEQSVGVAAAPPPLPTTQPDLQQAVTSQQVLPFDANNPAKPATAAGLNEPRHTVLAGPGKVSSPMRSGALFKGSPSAGAAPAIASSPVATPPANGESTTLEIRAADVNDNILADKAMQTLLPNGAHPAVTAAARQQVLAIDSSGALFRSDNAGALWVPVDRQWTGQATTLRVMMPRSVQSKTSRISSFSAIKENARPAGQKLAPLFELVNDQGGTWVSDDGKLWTQRDHR